jgi:hypothetical protein
MWGNAEGSTLRLSLGCVLAARLGIQLRRVGSGKRLTFSVGEERLSAWLEENARVAWLTCEQPWTLEMHLISKENPPLNLDHNEHCSFSRVLSQLRHDARDRAKELPILPR